MCVEGIKRKTDKCVCCTSKESMIETHTIRKGVCLCVCSRLLKGRLISVCVEDAAI